MVTDVILRYVGRELDGRAVLALGVGDLAEELGNPIDREAWAAVVLPVVVGERDHQGSSGFRLGDAGDEVRRGLQILTSVGLWTR